MGDKIDWKAIEECNAELFNPQMRTRIAIWEAAQQFIIEGKIDHTREMFRALNVFMVEVKRILAYQNIEREPEAEESDESESNGDSNL